MIDTCEPEYALEHPDPAAIMLQLENPAADYDAKAENPVARTFFGVAL